jgi:LysR family transcriptional regulator, glycine cleavage system transcriptional activator
MNDWLPSPNALRAFEAVCRHLNYVHAAEELHVTPAAVKQLVHKLEEAVGARLVERDGRGLAVTAAGRAGFEGLSGGFAQISKSVRRMRAFSARHRLIVSVEPSFATTWLVPRLERFRQSSSHIDVLIDSSLKIVDLENGEADVAIRFGAVPDRHLVAKRLFDETLCTFCSPSLAEGEPGVRSLDDLKRTTLIHWDTSALTWATATRQWMGWQPWLEAVGAAHVNWQHGLTFNDYNLAVQAAVAGQGIVLGSWPILRDLVEAKLLVSPLPERVHTNIGYDFVTTARSLERPEVRCFADWVAREANV